MIIFYFAISLLIFYKFQTNVNEYNVDYLYKDQCNSIKGIFILVVFLRHIIQYADETSLNTEWDKAGLYLNDIIGQLLVALFLFYSGYGVLESIKKKGEEYIDLMPKKRILTTLLNFDVAVALFIITDILLGIDISISQTLLSFTTWDSVGNSNWYIFCIILCYLLTFLLFKFRIVYIPNRRFGGVRLSFCSSLQYSCCHF